MTTPSKGRPAGPPKRELAQQLVAEIVAKASQDDHEAKQRAAQPPRRPRQGRTLALLTPVLLALTAWNVIRAGSPPQVFTPQQEAASLKVKIYLTAGVLEAFHDSAGSYPVTLAVARADDPALTYVPDSAGYTLLGGSGDIRIVYHHGEPLGPFAAAFTELKGRE